MASAESGPAMPAWAVIPGVPTGRIAGIVVSGGRPVAGAAVRASSGEMIFARNLDRHARADAKGGFELRDMPATNWIVTISAPTLAPEVAYVDLRTPNRRAESLSFELSACTIVVHGTVSDRAGGPIPRASVGVGLPWGNGGAFVSTDDLGAYELCFPPTPAGIPPGRPMRRKSLHVSADGYGGLEIEFAPVETARLDFVLDVQAVMRGRTVRSRDRGPVGGLKVFAHPLGADGKHVPEDVLHGVRRETMTDADGRFEIAGLGPGRYMVGGVGDEFVTDRPERVLIITPGEIVGEVIVPLVPRGVVEGRVLRRNAPVAWHTIHFNGVDPATGKAVGGWTNTLADGTFRARVVMGHIERVSVYQPGRDAPLRFPFQLTVNGPLVSGVVVEMPDEPR